MNENLAYFLDKDTFEIKECLLIKINEINLDLETNGNSSFEVIRKLDIEENDFLYLKVNNNVKFIGVVKSQEGDSNTNIYTITCKHILEMFNFESFIENESTIKDVGIEDFIANRISDEFISNIDSFCNKSFLEVKALTHTPKNISITTLANAENKIYNFLTLINNAIENYDLQFDFIVSKNKLKLEISTKSDDKILVDATVSDVVDYSELFSISFISKVECLDTSTNMKYYRYLLNDRTTTDNKNNPNRIKGETKRISVDNSDDINQAIADVFKGNNYQHNITFKINTDSKLIDVNNLKLGVPIQIKTKNNIIKDTYISKIKETNDKFKEFTCGNLRVDFIDKILSERKKI